MSADTFVPEQVVRPESRNEISTNFANDSSASHSRDRVYACCWSESEEKKSTFLWINPDSLATATDPTGAIDEIEPQEPKRSIAMGPAVVARTSRMKKSAIAAGLAPEKIDYL